LISDGDATAAPERPGERRAVVECGDRLRPVGRAHREGARRVPDVAFPRRHGRPVSRAVRARRLERGDRAHRRPGRVRRQPRGRDTARRLDPPHDAQRIPPGAEA